MTRAEIFEAISRECRRQELLAGASKIPFTCAWTSASDGDKCLVLTEELGEVARAFQEGNLEHAKVELIQLAACCVAWAESLP
jgi:hypothetical protein